jgi:rhodanese-related sulfurtransferase
MFNMFSRGGQSAPSIAPQDAVARVAEGSLTLIDIRDPFERKLTGTAEGAVAIPLAAFRMKVDPKSPERHPDLDPSKPVALYCASGARSAMAAGQMLEMGYTQVYNLGGIAHWRAGGGAVV